jgi:hypothetical protein
MRKLGLVRRPDLDYRPVGEVENLQVFSMSSKGWRGGMHAAEY